MRVLVVGSGGREHALVWALSASPLLDALFCAPGNAGIAQTAACVPIAADDIAALVAFARRERIDLVVVGPEGPLVAGLVDAMAEAGVRAFGPSAKAARLEASKGFTKDLCARAGIATAAYRRFTDAAAAKAHVRATGAPIVVKADGLAAGKGVTVAATVAEAEAAIEEAFAGRFGAAGASLVIESVLAGEEASFFALVDGRHAIPLAAAQDHKRAFDGDLGPNTGGMGAYSPAPIVTPALAGQVMDRIIEPTVAAMAAAGAPFTGILFAGLMIGADGPQLLEYNVRFGDPECQVLMPRLMTDPLTAFLAACDGELKRFSLRWRDAASLCVVLAAKGYPGAHERGGEIRGLEAAAGVEGVQIFHAATRRDGGRWLADGGRVLGVTASAPTLAAAQARAYAAVARIDWPGGFHRTDIGARALPAA